MPHEESFAATNPGLSTFLGTRNPWVPVGSELGFIRCNEPGDEFVGDRFDLWLASVGGEPLRQESNVPVVLTDRVAGSPFGFELDGENGKSLGDGDHHALLGYGLGA